MKIEIYYRHHNTFHLDHILSQNNPLHYPLILVFSIFVLVLSSHLCLGLPNGLFLSGFANKILYAFIISPSHQRHQRPLGIIHDILWLTNSTFACTRTTRPVHSITKNIYIIRSVRKYKEVRILKTGRVLGTRWIISSVRSVSAVWQHYEVLVRASF